MVTLYKQGDKILIKYMLQCTNDHTSNNQKPNN